jgi:hypothetical protein
VAFWIALAVLLAGLVGGLAYALMRGLVLWRQLKRTKQGLEDETARIEAGTLEIQTHLDRAGSSSEMLREAGARLATSRARLDLQLQAVREARHALRRVLWFVPGV